MWGLNSVLTQAVMEQGLVLLDSRSQHGHNPPMVVAELFLQDVLLCLPPTAALPPPKAHQLEQRLAALSAAITYALAESAPHQKSVKVDLIRWMPEHSAARASHHHERTRGGGTMANRPTSPATGTAMRGTAMCGEAWDEEEDMEFHGYSYKFFQTLKASDLDGLLSRGWQWGEELSESRATDVASETESQVVPCGRGSWTDGHQERVRVDEL